MDARLRAVANVVNRSAVAAPPTPDLAQRTPYLLINPRSYSAARGALATRAARLAGAYGAHVLEAADAAQIDAAIDVVSATPLQPVFVLAGDGTVQALVDRLAMLPAPTAGPQLLVLGGGRSNLTAADLGGSGAVLEKLESALRRWRDGPVLRIESRPVLCIEQPPLPPRHGFFLAAGLLDHVIRACHHAQMQSRGRMLAGGAGTAATVIAHAFAAMLGREPPLDHLRLTIPGRDAPTKPARFLLVTTLQRWPGAPRSERGAAGSSGLRFTALDGRGMALWSRLALRALASLRAGAAADATCEALHLQGLSSYTLDGEEFQADPARLVLVRTGPSLTFLTL
jgi:hypothetical protein